MKKRFTFNPTKNSTKAVPSGGTRRVGHFDDSWFRTAVGPGFQVGTKNLERARGVFGQQGSRY